MRYGLVFHSTTLRYLYKNILNRKFLQFQTKPIKLLSNVESFRDIYDIPLDYEPLSRHFQLIKEEYESILKEQSNEHSKRLDELKSILHLIQEIESTKNDLVELESLKKSVEPSDKTLRSAIDVESRNFMTRLNSLKCQIFDSLVPSEYIDKKDITLEITAGVGGKESTLFAKDLFDMYCNFSKWKGWSYQILQYDKSDLDGLRSGVISVIGNDPGRFFKFEGGVHRVQRVPKTERHGRIHTSVCTVAILPHPSDVEIKLDPKDLLIETKRASGAGGQHVNTTESCVRVTHLPSGVMVERQTEREQHINKKLALEAIRSILYQKQLQEEESKQHSNRKLQIGTGARSEKVRTYNYIQDRITDHRIGENIYGMEEFLKGQQKFEKLVMMLLDFSKLERLLEILHH
ncbi:peptide chain release factor 1-like, mitochondrial isoform X1 [Centruroides vittatus]|uniref:peptide chain release factor 1-like, mitochondrial isoform X1 n=1 Tax=Centruroides vittatus TaxID=120091 RepID=UPI00350FBF5C